MSTLRNAAWTLLRVMVGVGLATHGWGKIFGFTPEGGSRMVHFTGEVSALGFPHPVVFAWISALTELIGGSLVALGLFTRPAALLATINMGVAVYSSRHGGFPHWESGALYLVGMLFILLEGPGPASVDALMGGSKRGRTSTLR